MYSNVIGNYLDKQLKKQSQTVLKYSSVPLPGFKKNDFHKARIAIKKLRSLFLLLEFLAPRYFNENKYFKQLEKIFRQLGKIRDLQVNDSYMTKYNMPDKVPVMYRKFYDDEQQKAVKELAKSLIGFQENNFKKSIKKARNLCGILKDDYVLWKSKKFILSEAKQINLFLNSNDYPDNIHKIRRYVKSVYFNVVFLHSVKPFVGNNLQIAAIKKTEALIGTWHDREVLVNFIQKFIKSNSKITESDRDFFPLKIQKINDENALLLKALKPRLNNIIGILNKISLAL